MTKNFYQIILLFAFCCFSYPCYATDRVIPNTDLTYLGALKPPDDIGSYTQAYEREGGLGYDRDKDSLLLFARASGGSRLAVIGVKPPTPIISATKNPDELNSVTTLANGQDRYTDISGGQSCGWPGVCLGDAVGIPQQPGQSSAKVYWVRWETYDVSDSKASSYGFVSQDFADSLVKEGPSTLSGLLARDYSRYIMEINKSWADANASGRYVGMGRMRSNASRGPSLYAVAPWTSATAKTTLMYYPDTNVMESYSKGSEVSDAAWITIGSKQAFVALGTMGFRTEGTKWHVGGVSYHNEAEYGCNGDGYDAPPYIPMLLFYDVDQMSEIAAGTRNSYDIQPYAYYTLEEFFYRSQAETESCAHDITLGLAFDPNHNRLYVAEMDGWIDSGIAPKPLYHVFSLNNGGSVLDTSGPTFPDQTDMTGPDISWGASTDNYNDDGIIYVIYKRFSGEFRPIMSTRDTNWKDPKGGSGSFKVVAYDQLMNSNEDKPLPP